MAFNSKNLSYGMLYSPMISNVYISRTAPDIEFLFQTAKNLPFYESSVASLAESIHLAKSGSRNAHANPRTRTMTTTMRRPTLTKKQTTP
jgi:hypothetical protein